MPYQRRSIGPSVAERLLPYANIGKGIPSALDIAAEYYKYTQDEKRKDDALRRQDDLDAQNALIQAKNMVVSDDPNERAIGEIILSKYGTFYQPEPRKSAAPPAAPTQPAPEPPVRSQGPVNPTIPGMLYGPQKQSPYSLGVPQLQMDIPGYQGGGASTPANEPGEQKTVTGPGVSQEPLPSPTPGGGAYSYAPMPTSIRGFSASVPQPSVTAPMRGMGMAIPQGAPMMPPPPSAPPVQEEPAAPPLPSRGLSLDLPPLSLGGQPEPEAAPEIPHIEAAQKAKQDAEERFVRRFRMLPKYGGAEVTFDPRGAEDARTAARKRQAAENERVLTERFAPYLNSDDPKFDSIRKYGPFAISMVSATGKPLENRDIDDVLTFVQKMASGDQRSAWQQAKLDWTAAEDKKKADWAMERVKEANKRAFIINTGKSSDDFYKMNDRLDKEIEGFDKRTGATKDRAAFQLANEAWRQSLSQNPASQSRAIFSFAKASSGAGAMSNQDFLKAEAGIRGGTIEGLTSDLNRLIDGKTLTETQAQILSSAIEESLANLRKRAEQHHSDFNATFRSGRFAGLENAIDALEGQFYNVYGLAQPMQTGEPPRAYGLAGTKDASKRGGTKKGATAAPTSSRVDQDIDRAAANIPQMLRGP